MDLPSHIISVTLFPDRARVTRQGRVQLGAGRHKLTFADLPLSLMPESLRAAARGLTATDPKGSSTASGLILGVDLRRQHFAEAPADEVRSLEAQIAALEDEDAGLGAEAAATETEAAQLAALGAQAEMHARGVALRGRSAAETGALFAYIRERNVALQRALVKLRRQRAEMKKALDRLKRELAEKSAARPKVRLTAEVELSVEQGGEFEVDLTAVLANAGWTPLYDLRLESGDSRAGETSDSGSSLEVAYLASIGQNTGEDWSGVEVTLSTAFPGLALIVPELDPWYIGPKPPPVPVAARGITAEPRAVPQAAPAVLTHLAVPAAAAKELAFTEAEVAAQGAAVTYRLSDRADVPGNGDPRKVAISNFKLQPKLDYVTAPKLADAAYRRAKVKNDSPYSLLPGRAQLFEDNEYLGATDLDLVAPGEEFELTLGADDRVRVERELKQREVDKKLIGDRRRIRYGYEIKVTNLRDAQQTVTVYDQMPVARHESIKVKLERAEPPASEQTELNVLEWKLTLPPSGSQTVRFDFIVEYPRDMEVVGLP